MGGALEGGDFGSPCELAFGTCNELNFSKSSRSFRVLVLMNLEIKFMLTIHRHVQ